MLVYLDQGVVLGGMHIFFTQAAYFGYEMLGGMSSMLAKEVLEGRSDGYNMLSGDCVSCRNMH